MLRVLFFGSDSIAGYVLKSLLNDKKGLLEQIEVVTPPPSYYSYGYSTSHSNKLFDCGSARDVASKFGIVNHHAPNLKQHKSIKVPFSEWNVPTKSFDIGVVMSFGYFIPEELVKSFPLGMINIHPSLLPKYRGAAPIYHALMNGESETGVSIIEIDPIKFDTGNILKQTKIVIPSTMMHSELTHKLIEIGAKDLKSVLRDIDTARKNGVSQPLGKFPRAPKLKKGVGNLSFENDDASKIYNKWRALSESYEVFANWVSAKDGTVQRVCLSGMQPPVKLAADVVDKYLPRVGAAHKPKSENVVYILCKVRFCLHKFI